MDGSHINNLSEHPIIKSLMLEIDRLKKRLDYLESQLTRDHQKLERLEHEHEHDHEVLEKLEHCPPPPSSGGRRMTVGL